MFKTTSQTKNFEGMVNTLQILSFFTYLSLFLIYFNIFYYDIQCTITLLNHRHIFGDVHYLKGQKHKKNSHWRLKMCALN